jgi:hypothetical protein
MRSRGLILCRCYAGLIAVAAALGGQIAAADSVLWYNGDYDNRDALLNTIGTFYNINGVPTPFNSNVYDNFVVPVGQTWTVTSVFSNNQMNFSATNASWEIRQGVSDGKGGTIVASGSGAATQTPVPPVSGFFYGTPEYKISTTLAAPVVLTAGTYFLTVAPNAPGQFFLEEGFVETTSGANAVGMPPGNDGDSFINNNFPSSNPAALNFAPTSSIEDPTGLQGPYDYSMGLSGTFTSTGVVPEPSTSVLLAIGIIGMTVAGLSRRYRQATPCVAVRS